MIMSWRNTKSLRDWQIWARMRRELLKLVDWGNWANNLELLDDENQGIGKREVVELISRIVFKLNKELIIIKRYNRK